MITARPWQGSKRDGDFPVLSMWAAGGSFLIQALIRKLFFPTYKILISHAKKLPMWFFLINIQITLQGFTRFWAN